MIVLVKEGDSVNTIVQSTGNAAYAPEANVLWADVFALGDVADAEYSIKIRDVIKTKRLMQKGDALFFVGAGNTANLAIMSVLVTGFMLQ